MVASLEERTLRITTLVGADGFAKISGTHVVVAGYGAVGSFCVEALVRSGVGHIRIIDADVYEASNINRQLGADVNTLGKSKVEVGRGRLMAINPDLDLDTRHVFLSESDMGAAFDPFEDGCFADCIVDAIDSLDSKVFLLAECVRRGIRVYSSMGAARKTLPELIRVADISKTTVCPLAREVRRRLRMSGIEQGVRCVYSTENAAKMVTSEDGKRAVLGSIITVTGSFGLRLASEVLNDILEGG